MPAKKPNNAIDLYIANFPLATQKLLQQVRTTIRKAAPDAEEKMGYGIPTFTLHGNLVHFAGYKQHIGFYPGPEGISHFSKEMAAFKQSKGAVQFPLDKALPLALITKITRYRVKQNIEKQKENTLRTCPKGHTYYKSSDCPTCPICESANKSTEGFLSLLSNPAKRALEQEKITTLKKLSKFTEAEILSLHGMGPASIPALRKALKNEGLYFKK
ncbi:MAG: hypothetical protein K0R51_2960 [Cytophagaceae bacterium]|jgi:uncharacterized protein YdhG (YjbR/CyaY superfamily)|nr:hypothetical protein [Cytophagaceae bacterium]